MNFQTFLTEYDRIKKLLPVIPEHTEHSEDITGDYLYSCKLVESSFDTAHSSNGAYLFDSYMLVHSFDCDYCVSSEYLYESENCARCNNSSFLINCVNMIDCHYCVDGEDLKNCFGCVRLTHKQYCLFNRQYSKEEYFEKLSAWKTKPYEEIWSKVQALYLIQPALYKHEGFNENSEHGDYLYHDKNCYFCFDSSHSENCGYLFDTHESKYCFDQTYGFQCEFCYENNDSAYCYNSSFIDYCVRLRDCDFCFNCANCDHCFGCASLAHKKYCFLNRQLTPEEYTQKIKEVKESMLS